MTIAAVADALNEALGEAEDLFVATFHASASVELVPGTAPPLEGGTKLVFGRAEGQWHLWVERGSQWLPIRNASLDERAKAAHALDALWAACRERDSALARDVEDALRMARVFVKQRSGR